MLSNNLEKALNKVFQQANEKRHEFVTVEHLLLALLEENTAQVVLVACGANITQLRNDLIDFIEATTPIMKNEFDDRETQPTLGFHRVLQRAAFHVQSAEKEEVTGANVLVAIFSEKESQAVYFLRSQQITRLDLVNYMAHGISKVGSVDEHHNEDEDSHTVESNTVEKEAQHGFLEKFTINLNESAKTGRIDPLIGREHEVERVVQILSRRRKNNPLLVGEAGVGKTAIAEGLAKKIVEKSVPEILENAVVYSLNMGGLLAGTKYRGDFEKRFNGLLNELKKNSNNVLFIDEIHTIIGAGATSGGVMDASNLLKPLLSSGEIRCIGSTTFQEYRSIFSKDHALTRRFQKVDVLEPTVDETFQILKGLRPYFEDHHDIHYTDKALKTAAELAQKYINDRFLPDKAIDIVDEAGAYQRLVKLSKRKKTIRASDIEKVIAKIARIPEASVSANDKAVLQYLEDKLKQRVYGQDDAIEQVATAVKLARAGLRTEDKPIGSFLFAGPTGVGKTELTRQLAEILGIKLLRFDMSEYMERHTVSRLIGAPPGYVGFDQGGLLTDAVTKNPHSIVLLDEIEKAHPDVFNILLQVMDDGRLTDNNGRSADFRNVILIMTSNAGAQLLTKRGIGFSKQDMSSDGAEAVKRMFSPEFRNRLDAIVQFKQLSKEVVQHVLNKFIKELQGQLHDKSVRIIFSQSAKDWLIEEGYDEIMGARPMARVIQEYIKKPLAEMLLFGELAKKGGVVSVKLIEGKVELQVVNEDELAEAPA